MLSVAGLGGDHGPEGMCWGSAVGLWVLGWLPATGGVVRTLAGIVWTLSLTLPPPDHPGSAAPQPPPPRARRGCLPYRSGDLRGRPGSAPILQACPADVPRYPSHPLNASSLSITPVGLPLRVWLRVPAPCRLVGASRGGRGTDGAERPGGIGVAAPGRVSPHAAGWRHRCNCPRSVWDQPPQPRVSLAGVVARSALTLEEDRI